MQHAWGTTASVKWHRRIVQRCVVWLICSRLLLVQHEPLACLAQGVNKPCGVQVMEVQPEVRLCTVTEGLTEDAVSARLFQGNRLSSHSNRASFLHTAKVEGKSQGHCPSVVPPEAAVHSPAGPICIDPCCICPALASCPSYLNGQKHSCTFPSQMFLWQQGHV